MKKSIFTIVIAACALSLNAQILTQSTSPTTIGNLIPGYSEVGSTNTVTISYTPPVPSDPPTPIDGDTTTAWDGVYDYNVAAKTDNLF